MSAISQVRREGQRSPQEHLCGLVPGEQPLPLLGVILSIYKVGASEAVMAGWELGTQGARVISVHSAAGV